MHVSVDTDSPDIRHLVYLKLLLDAVLFGVIPIVYEYEGTTAESLCVRLEAALQGRNAQ